MQLIVFIESLLICVPAVKNMNANKKTLCTPRNLVLFVTNVKLETFENPDEALFYTSEISESFTV